MRTSDSVGGGERSWFARGGGRSGALVLRLGLAAAACGAIAAASSSCSLIVQTDADQCKATSDCASFPSIRSCTQGVCVAPSTPPACTTADDCKDYANATCKGGACVRSSCSTDDDCGTSGVTCSMGACVATGTECQTSKDCTDKGSFYVCRKQKCVSLVNDLCTTVHTTTKNAADAYLDDSAVIFGSILPTNGGADAPYGQLVEDSIKLAIDDFGKVGGIQGLTAGSTRPLVFVGCNDGPNEDKTDDAAKHLAEDLGVPAIIGYAFSGNTITVAQDVTIKDDVVLFSPSATSAQITNLPDMDLVWRTSPSDNVQAQALALYYGDVEAAAKAKYPSIGQGSIKVAIVNHSDPYGSGLGDTLEGLLTFNGKPALSQGGPGGNYLRVDYGKSNAPDLTKITEIVSFAPDVIFLFGFNEGPDVLFTQVEAKWKTMVPSDGHYPFWVFSDGGQVASLWATHPDATDPNKMDPAAITTEDQRTRVTGSVPGASAASWSPYGGFLSEFSSSSYSGDGSADTIGPAGAYDILYLLAYSAVMVGNQPLTGPNLVKYGLRMMQKSANLPMVQINRNNILTTFPLLTTGKAINVTGVSGPLPFDSHGDVTTADIQIWCVPKGTGMPDVGSTAISSGRYFDSNAMKMAGSISTSCGLGP